MYSPFKIPIRNAIGLPELLLFPPHGSIVPSSAMADDDDDDVNVSKTDGGSVILSPAPWMEVALLNVYPLAKNEG